MTPVSTLTRPTRTVGRATPIPPREHRMTLPSAPPYVVGGDISLTASGIAWPDRAIVHGLKRLTKLAPGPREHALNELANDLAARMWGRDDNESYWDRSGPDGYPLLAVLENLPTSGLAAMSTEKAYVWHELVRALHRHGVPILEVSPATIKKYATGKGNASKAAVIDALARRMPWFETLGDDNLCDAAWACAIGCDLLGAPIVEVPKTHRDALAKLKLPPGLS